MTFENACRIHDTIESTKHELRTDLYRCAARYAALRAEWHLATPEERRELDGRRTAAHNALIDAVNILARNLRKERFDTSWRKEVGDDRKVIGDFAVFLTARFGILAR